MIQCDVPMSGVREAMACWLVGRLLINIHYIEIALYSLRNWPNPSSTIPPLDHRHCPLLLSSANPILPQNPHSACRPAILSSLAMYTHLRGDIDPLYLLLCTLACLLATPAMYYILKYLGSIRRRARRWLPLETGLLYMDRFWGLTSWTWKGEVRACTRETS
jgi:hypothetical protein